MSFILFDHFSQHSRLTFLLFLSFFSNFSKISFFNKTLKRWYRLGGKFFFLSFFFFIFFFSFIYTTFAIFIFLQIGDAPDFIEGRLAFEDTEDAVLEEGSFWKQGFQNSNEAVTFCHG